MNKVTELETIAITDNQIIAEINNNGAGETYSNEIHQMYDDMLDECCRPVKIGSFEYCPSRVLEEVDPIAYSIGFNDWRNSEELDELEYLPPQVDKHDDQRETVYAYRKDIETAKEAIKEKYYETRREANPARDNH